MQQVYLPFMRNPFLQLNPLPPTETLHYLCANDLDPRRKLFLNVEGCPPVAALDQQLQIYLRDADS